MLIVYSSFILDEMKLISTFFMWNSRSVTFWNNKLSLFSTNLHRNAYSHLTISKYYVWKAKIGFQKCLGVTHSTLSVFKVAWYGPLPPHIHVYEVYALDNLSWWCQIWPFLKLTISSSAPFRSIKYLDVIQNVGFRYTKFLISSSSFPCKVCIPNLVTILT